MERSGMEAQRRGGTKDEPRRTKVTERQKDGRLKRKRMEVIRQPSPQRKVLARPSSLLSAPRRRSLHEPRQTPRPSQTRPRRSDPDRPTSQTHPRRRRKGHLRLVRRVRSIQQSPRATSQPGCIQVERLSRGWSGFRRGAFSEDLGRCG